MFLLCCYIEFQQLLVVSLVAIGLLYTGRRVVRSGVTSKRTGSRWEVRITVCYLDIACSCMTRWETPEVPCSCYGCTGCMFAYKSRCKYAGCCRPRKFRYLRACGQPHAASLQVAGPHVRVSVSCKLLVRLYGFHGRVGSHTRLLCKL